MRDQYNFLKAIDTSSSSPELKESHRPRKQQPIVASLHNRHHINHLASEAASSSASSNSNQNNNNKNINQTNGRNRAGLIKSKLQNFVRPRRFQLTSSGESKSSSTRQLHQQLHFARQEEDCDDEDTEEEEEQDIDDEEDVENNNPDDSDEEPEEVAAEQLTSELQHRLLSPASPQRLHQIDGDRTKQQQQITQPGVPIVCQIKKRTPSKRTQQMAAAKYREQQQQQLGQYLVNRPAPISRPNAMTTNQFATTNQNQTSISAGTVQAHAAANYNSSENQHQHTTTKQVMASGGRHELAKCYDEIDQIYDYIRGLAPLPANLRKIKAIDFEQIERERQRHKSNQQQQQLAQPAPVDPRQVHHQHRQRYVKSIGSSSQSSSVAPGGCVAHTTSQHHQAVVTPHANGAGANGNGTGIGSMAKKSAKVRQRVVAELIKSQEGAPMKLPAAMSVAPQQQQQATTGRVSSKLRETLQFIVPMPIRVTTKSAESQKPSIKRVESLNLGANGERLLSPQHAPKTTAAAVIQTKPTTTQASHHLQKPVSLNSRPSYLISGAQRGQLFRLPRAHSTSTLNKSTTTPLDQKRPTIIIGGGQQTELKQALKHEPVIQEDFPLVRLAARQSSGHQQQFDPQTGSLGRVGSSNNNKRPSFESDLVESYVDDDDDDEEQEQEEDNDAAGDADSEKVKASNEAKVLSPASRDKHHNSTSSAMAASLKSRSSDRLTGKSSATSSSSGTGGAGAKEEVSKHHHNQTDSSSSDSSSSEEDNDGEDRSASASERWSYADDSSKNQRLADKSHSDYDNDSASETSETTATTTTRTTATTTTTNTSNEEDEEIRQSFGGAARQRSTSSKRSHHNQLRPTTSSSPSSGRPASPVDMANESDEIEMNSGVSHKSSSFASGSRHQQQQREPNGLEARVSRVEHIYEQIPAHKGQDRSNSHRHMVPPITANDHHRQKSQTSGQMTQSSMTPGDPSSGQSMSSPSRRVASRLQPAAATAINHPVAYAANVAANRRYQQQVAALFALQQQRDRNQQLTRRNSRAPSVAQQQHQQQQLGVSPLDAVSYRPNHQRRSSASNSQFISPQPVHHSSPGGGPISLTIGSLKWKHQAARQLADVPHRQRYSMGNIHLISGAAAGIPLASLCSPKSKQHYQHQQLSAKQGGQAKNLLIAPKHHHLHHHHTTAWIDDQEAGSTGTTNSTSSYEAAIKNSEPDPLRIDMICPSDGEQSRQPSSKRSIGSGSGSRSLTNQSHHSMQNNNNSNNNTSIQQTSTLMKVPKLSKQSHLLQRPLPKPPVSSRSYASNTSSSRQPQKLTSASRTTSTSSSQPTKAAPVDVFS